MFVPASPEHVPFIPDQLPVEPPLAPNPPKLDNNYLNAVNYDDEEEPYEDLDDEEEDLEKDPEMDLDEEEEDPEMDLNEEEEDLEMDVDDESIVYLQGTHRTDIAEAHKEATRAQRRLDRFIWDMSFIIEQDIPELMKGSTSTGDRLTLLEQEQVKNREDIQRLKNQVHSTNIYATLAAMDKDRIKKNQDQDGKQIRELRHRLTSAEIRLEVASVDWYRLECELYSVQAQMYAIQQELYWRGFKENCPTKSIDVLATYGDADPPKLQEPSDMK
ncbi:hypothetical protein Tco_0327212 [Tanacetum coccineum]